MTAGSTQVDRSRVLVDAAWMVDHLDDPSVVLLEVDDRPDPRFVMTAAELEKKGVKDYQLDYALKTLRRLAPAPVAVAAKSRAR